MEGLGKYTVIDFTTGDYGMTCSEYLALAGMNVIRVASPDERMDESTFIAYNLNKKCITLDVEAPEGKGLFAKLLAKADVLVENRPYGYMDELGFGYERVHADNPTLIYASMDRYPKDSPWRDCPATSTTVSAMSGATYLVGYRGGIPLEPGPSLPDIICCVYTAAGIVASLINRETTGEGRLVEVNQQDSIIALERSAFGRLNIKNQNIRVGNSSQGLDYVVPIDLYPTKGGGPGDYVVIACFGDDRFKDLMNVMGRPDLAEDPGLIHYEDRWKKLDYINKIISDWTRTFDKVELMDLLLKQNRIFCSVVNDVEDLINAQEFRANGFMQKVGENEKGDIWLPTYPAIFSDLKIEAKLPQRVGTGVDTLLSAD